MFIFIRPKQRSLSKLLSTFCNGLTTTTSGRLTP